MVVYLTDSEGYGRHAMASQYFLQLANYLRIPVVAWNADNSAFEQVWWDQDYWRTLGLRGQWFHRKWVELIKA